MGHARTRIAVVLGEAGVRQSPAPNVLEDASVYRQAVVPALPLQDLEVDAVVAEGRVQLAIKDLYEVGFSGATGQRVRQPSP